MYCRNNISFYIAFISSRLLLSRGFNVESSLPSSLIIPSSLNSGILSQLFIWPKLFCAGIKSMKFSLQYAFIFPHTSKMFQIGYIKYDRLQLAIHNGKWSSSYFLLINSYILNHIVYDSFILLGI